MIIDALLDLLVAQGAEGLRLELNHAPVLSKGGEDRALSMPPLDESVFDEALRGVMPDDAGGAAETTVRSRYEARGRTFEVTISPAGPVPRIAFWIPGTQPEDAPVPNEVSPPNPSAAPASPVVSVPQRRSPVVATSDDGLSRLLQRAKVEDASDILVSTGRDARLRVGGELMSVSASAVDEGTLVAFVGLGNDPPRAAELRTTGSTDLALVHGSTRYRVNVFRQIHGLAAAFRPIRRTAPSLAELGLPEDFYRLIEYRSGLVLMTGTAGSGKSTTLVALLERLNRTQPKHVITLEDPIEYEYQSAAAMIHQRQVGEHVESFSTGLRAALREAPDVILLGEMRDRDTIAAALTAAETGHLVLSTLHCADAAMAVDRIVDVFPEHQQSQVREQLAGVLRAVVTQVLIPSLQPPRRVPAYEKLVVNTAVATKIRERRVHQIRSELHTGQADGMVPLEATLARLVRERRISRATARAHAHEPNEVDERLRPRAPE